jgi:para-nitrobenzyl esterase
MTRFLLAAITGAILMTTQTAMAQSGPEVTITSGTLMGTAEGGVESWKGIPYAEPPVGDLRWRAPRPAESWTGVRDATEYGSDCMQIPVGTDAAPLGTTPSEDCLYANVWRPAEATEKLPVLVWIYGGAFLNGGSSSTVYSGANLATKGVIVVSFNYRLGRFGTFAHPQLTAEVDEQEPLGNYGILDQIAALKWVRDNIAAFGGDPERVTVMGESAGGVSIHMLATSPLARGLFHGAINMSGTNGQRTGTATLAEIENLGQVLAVQHGISTDDPQALHKLRALTAEEIAGDLNMATQAEQDELTWAGPFVDGEAVVDSGLAYSNGQFAKVPMMIGATNEDLGGRTGFMVGGARRIANELSRAGVPIFHYRFAYVATSIEQDQTGALHATDIPFFLNTEQARYQANTSTRDNAVGELISDYVVQFAKTGDPNSQDSTDWLQHDAENHALMMFTPDGQAIFEADPWADEIDAAPDAPYPDFIVEAR